MTSHTSQPHDQFYDPDFDDAPLEPHEQRRETSSGMTFQIQLSPKKIFFSGFIIGAFLMGIPFAYLFARAPQTGDSVASAAQQGGTLPSDTAPPPQPSGPVKPISKDDHVRGGKNAELSIIEYSDFECPFCKRFHPTVQQALGEYKGKVNWVYRHFPLSFHANAAKEAEASECANELGGNEKFWKYTDKIFERTTANGTGFALDALVPLAKELGLNEKKFKECLDSGKYAVHVQQDFSEGQAAGIDGTPGNILLTKDGKEARVPGAVPYEQLKAEIDRLLTK